MANAKDAISQFPLVLCNQFSEYHKGYKCYEYQVDRPTIAEKLKSAGIRGNIFHNIKGKKLVFIKVN